MTTRQKNAAILIVAVLGTFGALFLLEKSRSSAERGGTRILDAIPADTFLLATVDVEPLRGSPLADPLRALGPGIGMNGKELQAQCGFDPFDRLDALALAIPEGEGVGDFGIVSAGRIAKDELLRCARTLMQSRSARLGTRDVSDFTLVEDQGTFAASQGKLAVRDGGPFLLSREPWLTSMIEAWDKKRPRIEASTRHMELRKELSTPQAPVVLVTALLPTKLRDRLKREMATNPGDATDPSNATMLGVLGVEAAGLSLTMSSGNVLDLAAELRCETEQDCTMVRDLIVKKRDEWASDLRLRFIGLGAVAQGLTVEAKGTRISARTRVAMDDARRLIDRLLELRSAPPNTAPGARAPAPTTTPGARASAPTTAPSARTSAPNPPTTTPSARTAASSPPQRPVPPDKDAGSR
ncbi:hypothetical protein [Pendulispora albinea]|uniref:Uncharacterized protein n=1 Tax=Pendulispora albinea TaxID=2741071 RepID=A0ABZ2LTE7_9BACT